MSFVKPTSSSGSLPLFEEESAMLDNPNLPLNIPASLLPAYRDMWKADKQCLICSVGFGLTQHKYRCKFCYRGVCSNCARHLFLHPELQIPKRCCNRCFRRFISSTLRDEIDAKIYESSGKISIIEDQLSTERKNREEIEQKMKDLQGQIRTIRLKMTKRDMIFEKEIEERKRKAEELRKIKEKLELKQSLVRKEVEETVRKTQAVLREKNEYYTALQTSHTQNSALKAQLTLLQDEACQLTHGSVTIVPCETDLKEVRDSLVETETSVDDSFGEFENVDLEREFVYLQAENRVLKAQQQPIQLGRQPRAIATTQAMAVRTHPERSCCTLS